MWAAWLTHCSPWQAQIQQAVLAFKHTTSSGHNALSPAQSSSPKPVGSNTKCLEDCAKRVIGSGTTPSPLENNVHSLIFSRETWPHSSAVACMSYLLYNFHLASGISKSWRWNVMKAPNGTGDPLHLTTPDAELLFLFNRQSGFCISLLCLHLRVPSGG